MNNYEGKHCEVCGLGKDITRDHIIPKWLEKRLPFFQLDFYMVNNDQYLCKAHNYQKGGIIDYQDTRVRRFIRKFINALEDKLTKAETEIRVAKMKATLEEKKRKQNEEYSSLINRGKKKLEEKGLEGVEF